MEELNKSKGLPAAEFDKLVAAAVQAQMAEQRARLVKDMKSRPKPKPVEKPVVEKPVVKKSFEKSKK